MLQANPELGLRTQHEEESCEEEEKEKKRELDRMCVEVVEIEKKVAAIEQKYIDSTEKATKLSQEHLAHKARALTEGATWPLTEAEPESEEDSMCTREAKKIKK